MSGGSKTQTVKQEPPSWLRPYIENAAQQASIAFQGQAPTMPAPAAVAAPATQAPPGMSRSSSMLHFSPEFSNQFLAPPASPVTATAIPQTQAAMPSTGGVFASPDFTTGQQMTRDVATAGASPLMTGAQDYMTKAMSGGFAGGNLQPQLDAAYRMARRGNDSGFAGAGRFGSGLHEAAVAESFANAAAPMMEQQRQFDTGVQQQAAMFAPQLAGTEQAMRYGNAAQLQQLGLMPLDIAQQYAQIIAGLAPGAGSTQSSPLYKNRAAGALGGAAAGVPLGGWGAVAGGLLGAFS